MKRHWQINRRSFLRGIGAAMALPYLQCMASDPSPLRPSTGGTPPKRFCGVYFPFGVSTPAADSEFSKWYWSPRETGNKYTFTESNKPLEPHRANITFLSGLSHPNGRKMGGHDTADVFLTGGFINMANATNTISLDQVVDLQVGNQTRYGSLALSSEGGVGGPTRSKTLSYSREGRPLPSLDSPTQIFSKLFGSDEGQKGNQAQQLQFSKQLLDRVLSHSKSLRGQLGIDDQRIFDQYLESVDATGKRVVRAQEWMKIPKPQIDKGNFKLDADPGEAEDYLNVMYDLMAYALQTDSVRAATYLIGPMQGSRASQFPSAIGLKDWHGLAHGANKGNGLEELGKFDQFLTGVFANFIKKLGSMKEGSGTVLDNTIVLYGSTNRRTHQNIDYPLVIAGGKSLGMKHGQHQKFDDKTPLANAYVTILQRLGIKVDKFADSTGNLNDVL